jgi:response regulator RpfG family c-di-GMP phosphodiesterase
MINPVILCVDDEPGNLKLLQRTLGSAGYLVVTADNGAEALEVVASRRIDLVLTDVLMPGVDGLETCRRLKGDVRYRHIPVIMITALGARQDRIRGIEAGADDFLSKPFDPAEVLARVKMLLRTKRLDEMLGDSYSNIQDLTSFGGRIMTTFSPADFDLMAQIDSLANQIIRKEPADWARPTTVLVRIEVGAAFVWHRYVYRLGRLKRGGVAPPPQLDIFQGVAEACFSNSPVLLPQLRPLVESLAAADVTVGNLACYLSDQVTVIAVNYGRETTRFDAAVLESLAMQTLFFLNLAKQISENENAFAYTVHCLARAAEVNDEGTGDHILRVGEFCAIVARGLGLAEQLVQTIRLQATLHDAGKLHLPSTILKKPGALDPAEWAAMKQHPMMGAKIIGEHPRFVVARQIALSHHERWDGTGYPFGFSGALIPMVGRIMIIADQYDALRSARSYKPALDHATARRIIIEGDGRTLPNHFDPQVLSTFVANSSRFEEVFENFAQKSRPAVARKLALAS